jgi:hypothetical protein
LKLKKVYIQLQFFKYKLKENILVDFNVAPTRQGHMATLFFSFTGGKTPQVYYFWYEQAPE